MVIKRKTIKHKVTTKKKLIRRKSPKSTIKRKAKGRWGLAQSYSDMQDSVSEAVNANLRVVKKNKKRDRSGGFP
ncbi:MAG TPA: hypothetical protein VMQ58_02470 [Candidatus Saccharimonadales bacterium]|nr:hypothetical protein [Candidatus Saccharimonadales bacterium]